MGRRRAPLYGTAADVAALEAWAWELRLACADAERAIRRGRRPAASLRELREASSWLRAVVVHLGSARVELARAQWRAACGCPVQLDLFREVA